MTLAAQSKPSTPPTTNRFLSFLNDTTDSTLNDAMDEEPSTQEPGTQPPNLPQPTNATTKRPKPPPIFVGNVTISDLIATLKTVNIKRTDFTIKQTDSLEQTIFASDIESFNIIKNLLISKNAKFFTYTPKSNKPKNLVLKGIHGNFPENEILAELKELNLPQTNILKVSKIIFNKKKTQKPSTS